MPLFWVAFFKFWETPKVVSFDLKALTKFQVFPCFVQNLRGWCLLRMVADFLMTLYLQSARWTRLWTYFIMITLWRLRNLCSLELRESWKYDGWLVSKKVKWMLCYFNRVLFHENSEIFLVVQQAKNISEFLSNKSWGK